MKKYFFINQSPISSVEIIDDTFSHYLGALKDKDSLLWFIIIPEGVQFVLGLVMYLTGFILACCCGGQSNANDKNEQEAAKRLKILRFNFGIYGFVYMSFKVLNLIKKSIHHI